jgi:hypothetical protein
LKNSDLSCSNKFGLTLSCGINVDEWLIEKFFVEALVDIDEGKIGHDRLLVLPPMPRNADAIADKRFRRAVRIKQD